MNHRDSRLDLWISLVGRNLWRNGSHCVWPLQKKNGLKWCLIHRGGGEGLSCGTFPDERRCSFVSVSALQPPCLNFSQFNNFFLCASRSASHPFISTSLPTIFVSFFQILLTHLPPVSLANSSPTAKIVSENTFLIYIFLLQLLLLPAVSNGNIAGTEYTRQNISWTSAVAFEAFNWCFHSAAGGKKTVGWLRLDKDWGLFILYDVRNHVHNFLIKNMWFRLQQQHHMFTLSDELRKMENMIRKKPKLFKRTFHQSLDRNKNVISRWI